MNGTKRACREAMQKGLAKISKGLGCPGLEAGGVADRLNLTSDISGIDVLPNPFWVQTRSVAVPRVADKRSATLVCAAQRFQRIPCWQKDSDVIG